MTLTTTFHVTAAAAVASVLVSAVGCSLPPPPAPEPVSIIELPLPPVVEAGSPAGTCTSRNGCIVRQGSGATETNNGGDFQSGDFSPDGKHVLAAVTFAGAAEDSIYTGKQLIIIKTDGTLFSNGDPWKCVTCGVPAENSRGANNLLDYPQAFSDGTRILGGTNVISCGEYLFTSDECTPERTFVYALRWNITPDGSGNGGAVREQRLHPDDVHLAFSNLYVDPATMSFGQSAYFSRLEFNPNPTTGLPLAPRYDLVNVTLLSNPSNGYRIETKGDKIFVNPEAISVGELRGISGRGNELLYLGSPVESGNIDIFAVHQQTGKVRRLTNHPEYVDPIDASPDDQWNILMDTRASGRQMFLAAMRDVPPLTDIVTAGIVSSVRNNGPRRFFQPWLLDRYAERGDYIGQNINDVANGTPGSGLYNDPEWNGMADPRWSPDGTQIAYWQAHTVSPECGGLNTLPCYPSNAPGGREYRLMVAALTSRQPLELPPVEVVADDIPWGTPYTPGLVERSSSIVSGNYTLEGKASGYADVLLDFGRGRVAVTYHDLSDDGTKFLNGYEDVTVSFPSITLHHADWFSDIVQTSQNGTIIATKSTSQDGFHLDLDVTTNYFMANGSLITTVGDVVYRQPMNLT